MAPDVYLSRSGTLPTRLSTGLRILWVTTAAGTDGPGRALLALLNHWAPEDRIAVCALRGATNAFRQETPDAVEIHELGMRGGWDVRALTRFIRLCRRWKPDVLHTQLSRADWVG